MSSIDASGLLGAGADGYQIERSLRFNSADSANCSRAFASAGNRKTWTWSGWVKRSALGSSQSLFGLYFANNDTSQQYLFFNSSDQFAVGLYTQINVISNAVFRDVSAWYHIVVAFDTTQATATNRLKAYVNGVEMTWATDNRASLTQNLDFAINAAQTHYVGYNNVGGYYLNGYLTEVHFIDGQALTPSSFGETDTITGVWKPKKYTGTYGTNGFYLKFADNSGTTSTTLGKDSSGNGNNWTPNSFSVTAGAGNDSMIDTPTPYADGGNGRGNYCTLNPLDNGGLTLANGNLDATYTTTAWRATRASIGISSGKWYWEITSPDASTSSSPYRSILTGIAKAGASLTVGVGQDANGWGYFNFDGTKYTNNTSSAYGTSWNSTNTIGVAFDADNGTLTFYRDNTSQGTAFTGLTSGPYFPAVSCYGSVTANLNFGQRAFAYTPPSGFLALNTQNLPEPTIKKPSSYMDVLTWTGNGAANNRSFTGLAFSPDLVWGKSRSNAYNNRLYDSVRGAGNNKDLTSNDTGAEGSGSDDLYGYISSFDSAGFSTTKGTVDNEQWNGLNVTYVAWCWDESATPGFDIVTFNGTGATQNVSHSLGVAPKMVLVKSRGASGDWWVYHESIGATKTLFLNLSDAALTFSAAWNNTAPTSSVFTVGAASGLNANGVTQVAYLWSEVAGFSKFGSYTGNGSSDGPFVFCGFRPKVVWFKRTDSTGSWFIEDSARGTYNVMGPELYANSSDAESTVTRLDFLSNGFKMRAANAGDNASGGTYIFCAWAESPAKYSLAR